MKEALRCTNNRAFKYVFKTKECDCIKNCKYNFDTDVYYKALLRENNARDVLQQIKDDKS